MFKEINLISEGNKQSPLRGSFLIIESGGLFDGNIECGILEVSKNLENKKGKEKVGGEDTDRR